MFFYQSALFCIQKLFRHTYYDVQMQDGIYTAYLTEKMEHAITVNILLAKLTKFGVKKENKIQMRNGLALYWKKISLKILPCTIYMCIAINKVYTSIIGNILLAK